VRHKASGPFVREWRRVRRATAQRLEQAAGLGTAKAAVALGLALGIGAAGLVAAAMPGERPAPSTDVAAPPAPREAPRAGPSIAVPESAGPTLAPSPPASGPSRPEQSPTPTASELSESPSAEPETSSPTSPPTSTPPTVGFRQEPDLVPPSTSLSHELPAPDAAQFTFGADEEATFGCSLDGAAFSPCTSPVLYSGLEPGQHTFAVTAVDAAGNADPSPATIRWRAKPAPSPDQ